MILFKTRREREFMIVSSMIRMYCSSRHGRRKHLCRQCHEMEQYAGKRLERCKFGDYKPVCKDCWVHCYSAGEREYMQEVMRWAGPRMLYIHPLYAIIHLIDSRNQPFSKNNLKKSL